MTNSNKDESPLVASVVALQSHLSELERIGAKINATDMTQDIDVEHVQKLMARFAECGQGVSVEVSNLSVQLQQARTRAETVAEGVSRQAEAFNIRTQEQSKQFEKFRLLGERVRELNSGISLAMKTPGNGSTDLEESELKTRIPNLERELTTLIGDLQELRASARASRMKTLEKNAESLAQTLQAVQVK